MGNELDHDTQSRVRELLALDRKIEAIKVYREATGLGLAEAKHAVEMMDRAPARPGAVAAAPNPGDEHQVRELLLAGRKIEAIKHYREAHGSGLREAKDAVEAMERSLPPAPGGPQSTSRSGCGATAALAVAVAVVALFLR